MENYELTFLVNNQADAKEVKTALDQFSAKVISEESWGKRALAYQINKLESAEYFTYKIQIAADKIEEFKIKLNFNEKVIRYLLLKEE